MSSCENFSLESLNPLGLIKSLAKKFLWIAIHAIVAGLIIATIASMTGLLNENSIKNYIKYVVIGSVVMYLVTFAYMYYSCRHKKVDLQKLAKMSTLGPSVIVAHLIVLIVTYFLQYTPEVGLLIYGISWSQIGVVLVSGIMYAVGLQIAEVTGKC